MEGFTVSLAEIPIGIQPISPDIRPFFADYLTGESPCFTVAISEKALDYERAMTEKTYRDHPFYRVGSALDVEKLALLRLIADRIPEYNAILFHGSAVAVDGKAYLFAAPSRTGKTTHTRLWLQQLPQAYVLNGDKPFLKVDEKGRILACGTPWRGLELLGCSEILPLEAICLLERADENHICSVRPTDAIPALLHQAHLPEGVNKIHALRLLNTVSCGVRLYRLQCSMDPEAARVSIRAMLPG